jgi:hypothetical protein
MKVLQEPNSIFFLHLNEALLDLIN